MSIKKFVNLLRNPQKLNEDSLEKLLLSIKECEQDNKKIRFGQYGYSISHTLSNTIMQKKLVQEEKKDISNDNRNDSKKLKKSNKQALTITAFTYLLAFFVISLSLSFDFTDFYKDLSEQNLTYLKYFSNSIAYLFLFSFFINIFIGTKHDYLSKKNAKKINKNLNILEIKNEIKENIIKEIELINNPELDNVKQQFKEYIYKNKLSSDFFKSLDFQINKKISDNTLLNLEQKILKFDKKIKGDLHVL